MSRLKAECLKTYTKYLVFPVGAYFSHLSMNRFRLGNGNSVRQRRMTTSKTSTPFTELSTPGTPRLLTWNDIRALLHSIPNILSDYPVSSNSSCRCIASLQY